MPIETSIKINVGIKEHSLCGNIKQTVDIKILVTIKQQQKIFIFSVTAGKQQQINNSIRIKWRKKERKEEEEKKKQKG